MRVHGGRWADYLEEHGALPLDFSANVSPLGMPVGARAAAITALEHAERYPDPLSRALRHALAECHGLDPAQILVGNGAGDLIDRLVLALRPHKALVTAPTFGEYRAALERVGCHVMEHSLTVQSHFEVNESILERIDSTLDVLVLCEPNNPTGRTSDPELLARVANRCDECGTLLVVDECFADFLDHPDAHSLLPLVASCHAGNLHDVASSTDAPMGTALPLVQRDAVQQSPQPLERRTSGKPMQSDSDRSSPQPLERRTSGKPMPKDSAQSSSHVLVLRAFTKFYGMAGLRLGWCASTDVELLRRMAEAGQPWPVSIVAQEAGIAALADVDYAHRLRALVQEERPKLAAGLRSLACRVMPGEANYLLFWHPMPDLAVRLRARGILIRDCSDYAGLAPGWYRVAVRNAKENACLLAALASVLG